MLAAPTAAEGHGLGLLYLAIAVVLVAIFGSIAALIGHDATRHGRNGWAWGLAFIWSPLVVGVAYLIARHRAPSQPATN